MLTSRSKCYFSSLSLSLRSTLLSVHASPEAARHALGAWSAKLPPLSLASEPEPGRHKRSSLHLPMSPEFFNSFCFPLKKFVFKFTIPGFDFPSWVLNILS